MFLTSKNTYNHRPNICPSNNQILGIWHVSNIQDKQTMRQKKTEHVWWHQVISLKCEPLSAATHIPATPLIDSWTGHKQQTHTKGNNRRLKAWNYPQNTRGLGDSADRNERWERKQDQ